MKSKIIVGSAVAIILLMVFSSATIAAESENGIQKESVILYEGEEAHSASGLWIWDHEKCILTLKDGFDGEVITVTTKTAGMKTTVIVEGTITVANGLDIHATGDVLVRGNGTLCCPLGIILTGGSTGAATVEGISIDAKTNSTNTLLTFEIPTMIKDCPSIKLHNDEESPLIYSTKASLEIKNTNLYLEKESSGSLIECVFPFFMDKEPTGEDLIFVNDGTDDDVFISGTTTQIYTESDGATMTMESYVPESDSGNLPIYIGVALLVIVIIAVGMYTAFKS